MSTQDPKRRPLQWRSLPELDAHPKLTFDAPSDPAEVSRRAFMGLMGASAALAGANLSGCVRKQVQHVIPYAKRPEDLIPGNPTYYATAFQVGARVQGIVVESQEGRPTKVEGNPQHPMSQGAADAWAQASVLNLYDPHRSAVPKRVEGGKGSDLSWEALYQELDATMKAARAKGGQGVGIVLPTITGPSLHAQLAELQRALPKARWFRSDPAAPTNAWAGAALVAGAGAHVAYDLEGAQRILALDCDFLGREGDVVANARAFADGRRVAEPTDPMNRLYAVEPNFSATGATADHRLRLRGAEVGDFLRALAKRLFSDDHVPLPAGADAIPLDGAKLDEKAGRFLRAVSADLAKHKGAAVVLVGERQPAWVHALGHLVNAGLGAFRGSKPVARWARHEQLAGLGDLQALAKALADGALDTLVVLGASPLTEAPSALKLAELWPKAATRIHAGLYFDATARACTLHLPVSHDLEAWGDARSTDGTVALIQPLIDPLYFTPSLLELAARLATGKPAAGYALVRSHWRQAVPAANFDIAWRRWLHTGVIAGAPKPAAPSAARWEGLKSALAGVKAPAALGAGAVELNFHIDPKVLDGRWANNGWLQELPDPMTKLTWDNAALVSKALAQELGVVNGDLVRLEAQGASLELPIFVAPGQAARTVSLHLGYGRDDLGQVAQGAGFDVNPLRPADGAWFRGDAKIARGEGSYDLATTQKSGSLTPPGDEGAWKRRPIVRVGERLEKNGQGVWVSAFDEERKPNREFVKDDEFLPDWRIKSLSDRPEMTGDQQWGMSIDLNACTGCNACVVACVAENNIPVVGKARVLKGREMHWLRIDRYYEGDGDEPQAEVQPMGCQQCENAPCETVCPVAATTHSPEGLNDMAYNRCVGTRYCSNNCPYKVRRFNFFNYNNDIPPLVRMLKNPDVTIRFRGVMEKCTYCVQRITEARIEAKVHGDGHIPDIADPKAKTRPVVTACQQTCPTQAIVFGDIANENSQVSILRDQPRRYEVLGELNTKPRTTYLAKIRNPNPDLV